MQCRVSYLGCLEFMQRVSPPSLRTRLYVDRHHHSDINRQRVDQPLHVSLCLLG